MILVGGVQYAHGEGTREANWHRAAELIRAEPKCDLYVLPELATSGYGKVAFDMLDALAEDAKGPSYAFFAELAREQKTFICYSFPRRQAEGKPTISAAVVNREGELVALYDKWHVCQNGDCYEKDYFASGHTPTATFSLDGIQVGICICYDIRFPELVRKMAIEDKISLLIHPGGWPRDAGFSSWHTTVATRSIENTIYIMSANRATSDNGHSVFYPPYVDMNERHPQMLADKDGEGVLIGTVSMEELARVRKMYPLLSDRRPELY